MGGSTSDLSVLGFALASAAHLGFLVHLLRSRDWRQSGSFAAHVFSAALGCTAAWTSLSLLDALSGDAWPAYAAAAFDISRYALWFAFLLLLVQPEAQPGARFRFSPLAWVSIAVVALGCCAFGYRVLTGQYELSGSRFSTVLALVQPVLGLLLVEQLFRNLPDDSRWNAKPVCMGLALIFTFDLFLYAEAVLFGRIDPDVQSIRGAVHLLAVPLLALASQRRADWIRRLHVSRSAAFYSATLLLAGGYLLFMAAVGYYVRYFGGEWGRALQIGLLVAALVALTVVVLSGSLRARLRVFVGKHFFSYRYDYREEWLRFTAMLSSRSAPQEVGSLVVRGLANMVECPAGSLWTRTGSEDQFRQTARWNHGAVADCEPEGSAFCTFLLKQGWVIDLDEYRNAPRRYGDLVLPAWLLTSPNAWLVVPLASGDGLLGFVTLARPRTPMELNWEVRDLLKTASRQAAGYLAQMSATEELLEARKFEAFNRMSAFVVHDLKNIVTQLSLMMKNAQRLHANPEFQQDMLLTVDSSLEKMRRLMLQLREGATPPGGAHGVELAPILRRLGTMAQSLDRQLEVECPSGLATRGHDERLERVLGHLVHNALDATPPSGRVWVKAARFSGQIRVDVGDTGTGMSEEFVHNKLFRPFSTTKHSGMGIGSYESFQYIRELGGTIAVDSQIGRGTVITLHIPLFESAAGSDLQLSMPS